VQAWLSLLVRSEPPANPGRFKLDRAGQPLTFATVARAAHVSRSWLYNQPDLRATITRLRSAASLTDAPPIPAAQRATSESLHQRLDATRDEITQLRAENAVLRDRLARSLGDQRSRR
jgi:hypothetical protein